MNRLAFRKITARNELEGAGGGNTVVALEAIIQVRSVDRLS